MKNLQQFEECLLTTYLVDDPIKSVLKWISFYENETGNKINKEGFETWPREYFMNIMNQLQDYRNNQNGLNEEIVKIKKLL